MGETGFYIDKWYLDFVNEDNEVWIFYAAKLYWHGIVVPYTAIISGGPGRKSLKNSRYRHINFPECDAGKITWNDSGFDILGTWELQSSSISSRLFEDNSGYLDWHCHIPSGKVKLNIKGREMTGTGYVEQLKITIPPWVIPIDELRWGRFISEDGFRNSEEKNWVWINGDIVKYCTITDNQIKIAKEKINIEIDKVYDIENEQSINKVVKNLVKYIPGFGKALPLKFLLAQNHKWFSKGVLHDFSEDICSGNVIHELVEFKLPG